MLLAESAGFDVVLVETVGVGQSETAVADMTDLFVLLASPRRRRRSSGHQARRDELADLLIVTKADGDLLPAANRAAADYNAALHLMRPKHQGIQPKVLTVSSVEKLRIDAAWEEMASIHAVLALTGQLTALRGRQNRRWFWNEVQSALSEAILENQALAKEAARLEEAVAAGQDLPYGAAKALIAHFRPA